MSIVASRESGWSGDLPRDEVAAWSSGETASIPFDPVRTTPSICTSIASPTKTEESTHRSVVRDTIPTPVHNALPESDQRREQWPLEEQEVPATTRGLHAATSATRQISCTLQPSVDAVAETPNRLVEDAPTDPALSRTAPVPAPTALSTSSSAPVLATSSGTVTPPMLEGKFLVVDQTAQMLQVYENGMEARVIPVSTGVRSFYTPQFSGYVGHYVPTIYGFGSFADHAWYITKGAGNIYIHGAPYTLSDGQRIYDGLEFLGWQPISHGCIRVHPADAEWPAEWNPQGVPILITPPDFRED
jgi:lipoprotein-anchoring transpeptidase ErfK/SrfK